MGFGFHNQRLAPFIFPSDEGARAVPILGFLSKPDPAMPLAAKCARSLATALHMVGALGFRSILSMVSCDWASTRLCKPEYGGKQLSVYPSMV